MTTRSNTSAWPMAQTGEVLVKLTGDRNEVMTQKSTPIPAAAYDRDLV